MRNRVWTCVLYRDVLARDDGGANAVVEVVTLDLYPLARRNQLGRLADSHFMVCDRMARQSSGEVHTMKTKSALSYFGADGAVADDLAVMLDHCSHVTIPFVGGASILPRLKARAIVANDLHGLVIHFYQTLAGHFGDIERRRLIERCYTTISHPREIETAMVAVDSDIAHVRAWGFWALCWIGRKGKGGTRSAGGKPSVRFSPQGGTNATRLMSAALALDEWAKEFQRCEFTNLDFRELLPKVRDDAKCGIYADPPWVGAGRNYLHSFGEIDHRDLSEQLRRFNEATVVVRYGDDPFIRSLYEGWTVIEAEARDQCNAMKGEIWITNRM